MSSAIRVNGIGLFDTGANGLGMAVQVGLWTVGGALLASATVDDASDPVASASANGQWLFEDIATLTLGPGDYLIGAVFTNAAPPAQTNAPFVTIPEVTMLGGRQGDEGVGLDAPEIGFNIPIFGPTLQLVVPLPGSLALLGLGLVALAGLRRKAS